jgi:hypothetical protein
MKTRLVKFAKLLLKIFAGLIGSITLLLLAVSIVGGRHEAATKKLLSQEISKLPIPAGCTENSRQYQNGGLDTVSSWNIDYSCHATGAQAYNSITTALKSLGYTSTQDYSNNGDYIFYSFTYTSSSYQVEYSLNDFNGPSYPAAQKSELQAAPVNSINLQITRKPTPASP